MNGIRNANLKKKSGYDHPGDAKPELFACKINMAQNLFSKR